MALSTPQRVITLTINGTDSNSQVYYTYASPVTGSAFINAPLCDMVCNRSVNSMFVLDYMSSLNGWTITGTSPNQSPALEFELGPKGQSVMTINPYDKLDTYNFYINYKNVITEAKFASDPQERNVPN